MSVLLGMPSFLDKKGIDNQVAVCLANNLDFIELNMNSPYFGPAELPNIDFRKIEDQQLYTTVHLPDEIDLAHLIDDVRFAYVKVVLDTIDALPDTGSLLNIHMSRGPVFTMPDTKVYVYAQELERYLDGFCKSMDTIMYAAGKKNVSICFENTANFDVPYIQQALMSAIEMGAGLTYDYGHDAAASYRDRPFFVEQQDVINHIHLHDVTVEKSTGKVISDHQPLYTGIVDIDSVLKFAMMRNIGIVVEVRTVDMLETSLDLLRKKMLKIGEGAQTIKR